MRKFIVILLSLIVIIVACVIPVFASTDIPVLTLEKNQYNSNGERHIKVSWEGMSGTYQLQIDDDEGFGSPITKKRSSGQGQYYNFVLSENVDATYYIRVRLNNGNSWSNVVIANMDNKIEDEHHGYFKIPTLPKIPNISINPDMFSNIDWSKIININF